MAFFNEELKFTANGNQLSQQEIEKYISFDFKGKSDFIKFYSTYNGISFSNSTFFYRDFFFTIDEDDYNLLSIEAFLPIIGSNSIENLWDAAKENRRLYNFAQTHVPFAIDASGNFFWIEFISGQVKYLLMESPNEEMLVAPSFLEFCKNIQGAMR